MQIAKRIALQRSEMMQLFHKSGVRAHCYRFMPGTAYTLVAFKVLLSLPQVTTNGLSLMNFLGKKLQKNEKKNKTIESAATKSESELNRWKKFPCH